MAAISVHSFIHLSVSQGPTMWHMLCWGTEMNMGFCFSGGSLHSNVEDRKPSMKRNHAILGSELSAMTKKHG